MLDHENLHEYQYTVPFMRTPFTDFLFGVRNYQNTPCAQYELQYIDCLEAYGYHKGKQNCRMILNDLHECVYKTKRLRRIMAMHKERKRQFDNGERKEKYEETPPLDLF